MTDNISIDRNKTLVKLLISLSTCPVYNLFKDYDTLQRFTLTLADVVCNTLRVSLPVYIINPTTDPTIVPLHITIYYN